MDELSMHSETLDSLNVDGLRQRKPPILSSSANNNNNNNNDDDAHNVDDIDTELVFPLRSETHTKNPLTTSKKKKKLLRTASSNERSDYATSTEKKPHCNTLDSPTNPPIKRFLERQRSLTGTETEIGNDADGVDEESGHTTWLVKMGKKYETVLDSLPARCIGTICNIVLTGGFFLFFIFCIAALFSLSYLYDHKDSGKQNKLIILNIIVFQ